MSSAGLSPTAPGFSLTAPGFSLTAPGFSSTAPGFSLTAPGFASTAPGFSLTAPGFASTAPGFASTAPDISPEQQYRRITEGSIAAEVTVGPRHHLVASPHLHVQIRPQSPVVIDVVMRAIERAVVGRQTAVGVGAKFAATSMSPADCGPPHRSVGSRAAMWVRPFTINSSPGFCGADQAPHRTLQRPGRDGGVVVARLRTLSTCCFRAGWRVLSARSWVLSAGFGVLSARDRVPSARSWVLWARSWVPSARNRVLSATNRVLSAGSR